MSNTISPDVRDPALGTFNQEAPPPPHAGRSFSDFLVHKASSTIGDSRPRDDARRMVSPASPAGASDAALGETRQRQTATPPSAGPGILATTNTLLSGATVVAAAVGGPVAAVAVTAGGEGIKHALMAGGSGAGSAGNGGDYFSQMRDVQEQGMRNSSDLLNMQRELQDENRRFTALSNVMRTKHDTSKAAVGNIRA
jgi:hypothetical protein